MNPVSPNCFVTLIVNYKSFNALGHEKKMHVGKVFDGNGVIEFCKMYPSCLTLVYRVSQTFNLIFFLKQ